MHSNYARLVRRVRRMSWNHFDEEQLAAIYRRVFELGYAVDLRHERWMSLYFALARFSFYMLENGLYVAVPWAIHVVMLQNLIRFGCNKDAVIWLRQCVKMGDHGRQIANNEGIRILRRKEQGYKKLIRHES